MVSGLNWPITIALLTMTTRIMTILPKLILTNAISAM